MVTQGDRWGRAVGHQWTAACVLANCHGVFFGNWIRSFLQSSEEQTTHRHLSLYTTRVVHSIPRSNDLLEFKTTHYQVFKTNKSFSLLPIHQNGRITSFTSIQTTGTYTILLSKLQCAQISIDTGEND